MVNHSSRLPFCAELLYHRADVGFPREGFVLCEIVGREVWNWDAKLVQQFGGFGEFVAMHKRLAIGPGPLVGCEGVALRLFEIADGLPEQCQVARREPA